MGRARGHSRAISVEHFAQATGAKARFRCDATSERLQEAAEATAAFGTITQRLNDGVSGSIPVGLARYNEVLANGESSFELPDFVEIVDLRDALARAAAADVSDLMQALRVSAYAGLLSAKPDEPVASGLLAEHIRQRLAFSVGEKVSFADLLSYATGVYRQELAVVLAGRVHEQGRSLTLDRVCAGDPAMVASLKGWNHRSWVIPLNRWLQADAVTTASLAEILLADSI